MSRWNLPANATMDQVNAAFGTDMYRRLQQVWTGAMVDLAAYTGVRPDFGIPREPQTRTLLPEELVSPEGKADPTSVHYLGLARDVDWHAWPEAWRQRVANYIEAQGFAVERTKQGQLMRRHLHYGVPKARVVEAGLLPLIQQTVAAIRASRQIAGR